LNYTRCVEYVKVWDKFKRYSWNFTLTWVVLKEFCFNGAADLWKWDININKLAFEFYQGNNVHNICNDVEFKNE
jgi:hypothetical protein